MRVPKGLAVVVAVEILSINSRWPDFQGGRMVGKGVSRGLQWWDWEAGLCVTDGLIIPAK